MPDIIFSLGVKMVVVGWIFGVISCIFILYNFFIKGFLGGLPLPLKIGILFSAIGAAIVIPFEIQKHKEQENGIYSFLANTETEPYIFHLTQKQEKELQKQKNQLQIKLNKAGTLSVKNDALLSMLSKNKTEYTYHINKLYSLVERPAYWTKSDYDGFEITASSKETGKNETWRLLTKDSVLHEKQNLKLNTKIKIEDAYKALTNSDFEKLSMVLESNDYFFLYIENAN